MATGNTINGVSRDSRESYSKVNGVWRKNFETWSKFNGVWRLNNNPFNPNRIIGFKLVYTLNANRIHHDIPRLKYNPKIPHVFKLTGDSIGNLDLTHKGVIFEYKRDETEEEGIVMYEGRLYAILDTDEEYNVCLMYGNNDNKQHEDEMVSEFVDIYEASVVHDVDIKLTGYVAFEDYGYYFAGWNSLFNTKPFIDKTIQPDKTLYKKKLDVNLYNIHPMCERDEYFDSVSSIGVARDLETPIYNMIGSHGVLDHTITRISLNGVDMPFIVEIK